MSEASARRSAKHPQARRVSLAEQQRAVQRLAAHPVERKPALPVKP